MKAKSQEFYKVISVPESDGFIACFASVKATADGYWISVITDEYEGNAMVTLPCAEAVYEALAEAIAFSKERRRER